jgi:uncharacterized protein (DUF4415 family)
MNESKRGSAPWIDPDDAPDLSAVDIEKGVWRLGQKVVSTGLGLAALHKASRGRPKSETPKEAVKIRLDADVVAALRATGDGWQTRINETLRASLKLAGKV